MNRIRIAVGALVATGLLAATACTGEPLALPSAEEVESYYLSSARLTAEMSGNVAVVTVVQDAQQLRRGGTIWARVGPYVYLFTEATRDLFQDYDGLAAVRVVTTAPGGTEIARATLNRTALNDLTWRRALNIAGQARLEGTRRLTLLEDLIRWGEDHTEYEYNPRYTRRR